MKRTNLIAAIMVLGIGLTGCAATTVEAVKKTDSEKTKIETKAESNKTSKSSYEKKYNDLKEKNSQQAKRIDELEKEVSNLRSGSKTPPDNSALAFKDRAAGLLYFPIYTQDPNTMEQYVGGYIGIKPQDSLENKLRELTKGLSTNYFQNLPMKFVSIQEIDGKKVARIDLIGKKDWENKIFAGSTGGGINSQTLVNSYLQKKYTNSWIDGVVFTWDGEKILTDHAPLLEEPRYRK